jgi:hypothetical protein
MLGFLKETFKKLSWTLQKFQDFTCTAFNTVELPKEKVAHHRRLAQRSETHNASTESTGARAKKLNLSTYKFHTMGDYVKIIRFFGTTDSFTTQIVHSSYILTSITLKSIDRGSLHIEL